MNEAARDTAAAAAELARACATILGPNLHAAVLHGSLALGDFAPGRSDIDLLLITGPSGLSREERESTVHAVADAEMAAAWAIDLIAVTSTTAGAPSLAPLSELQVARYPDEIQVEERRSAEEDLVVELSMARATGRSLVGVPAEEAIGTVPAQWVRDRGLFWLRRWLTLADDAEHAELMVLTACRVWHLDIEGTYCSKPQAGRWALGRDPSLAGVTRALRQRQGDTDALIPADEVTHVLRTVLQSVDSQV